jgi:hypothetical protein
MTKTEAEISHVYIEYLEVKLHVDLDPPSPTIEAMEPITPTRYRQLGSVLLEQTVVLPILLITVLSLIDITNLIRTYSTIREAAAVTAKELADLEGAGSKISADTRVRQYEWTSFTFNATGKVVATKLAGTYPEESTPSTCQSASSGSWCTRQFLKFATGGSAPKKTFDLKTAVSEIGFKVVQASRANARLNCSESHCVNFESSIVDEQIPGQLEKRPAYAAVRVSYKLPILWIGNSPITVWSSAQERIETAFLDNHSYFYNGCKSKLFACDDASLDDTE